jgi:nucleotide-binding universal stress UspA family protein
MSSPKQPIEQAHVAEPASCVVFALRADEFPSESLRRAVALCEAMHADLRILRVVDPVPFVSRSMRPFDTSDATRALDALAQLRRATQSWIESTLGGAFAPHQLELARGDFVEVTRERTLDLGAVLTVVAPSQRLLDSSIESLATQTGIPVLVARSSAELDPFVVAATDLEDTEFPVLRAASKLAQILGAAVIPVHNVSPLPVLLREALHHPRALSQRAAWIEIAQERKRSGLERAADELELGQAGVVLSDYDAARGILEEARSRKADLVVVGLRNRSWLERLLSPSVATCIVRDARRSVLITPLTRQDTMRA